MRPYALKADEGWMYRSEIDFVVKAGELSPGRGAAVLEFTTWKGEEPPDHTHETEDEAIYVLRGELTFRCGGETFNVETGGFVYLPRGIEHGYTIRSKGPVRLLVLTFPVRSEPGAGWGGFIGGIEREGKLVSEPGQS